MCILCGEFIEQVHWTDTERQKVDTVVAGQYQRERKRARNLRAKICSDILAGYSIKLKEWNNSKFIISNSTGKTRIIHDLGQVWQEAESFIGAPVDPLDPELLEALQQK